ncbi:MAG: hypothetical protein O7C98_03525 [Planctomycetota bacterium]|nr:hypothetical protein [Planctomycetota bacterium]
MMRRFAVVALLLPLASAALAAPLGLGKPHKDETEGYRIQVPAKWEQVPTKFQEVNLLAKWAGKARRGWIMPGLQVFKFPKHALDPSVPSDAEGAPEHRVPGFMRARNQAASFWEMVKNRYGLGYVEDPSLGKKLKMRDKKLKGALKVFIAKGGMGPAAGRAGRGERILYCAAIEKRENPEAEYGVLYACSIADLERNQRAFVLSMRRFRVLDLDEEDEEEEGSQLAPDIFVSSESKPQEWREARKKKLAGLKDWAAIDTKNYLIVYNKKVKRTMIKKIAVQIEAIREQVYEVLFPPARRVKAISVVRVCKDMAEYHRYGGPGGSAGYWSRRDEELVFPGGGMGRDSLRVLYHEAFHQYIHYAVGDVAPHSWFNEGHGDYFAGHNYKAKKFKPAPFRWRTGIITNAIAQKSFVPLESFLKYTQGEYYSNPGLCYAQGWSFVYFLREVKRRKIKKYKQYWGLLDKYFDAVKRNVKAVKEQGLQGLDPTPPPDDGPSGPPDEPPDGPSGPPEPPDSEGGEELEDGTEWSGLEPEASQKPEPNVFEGVPVPPGLEGPFPGENPAAGINPDIARSGGDTSKSVVGKKITGVKSALDNAVDEAFRGIDWVQLEKDWIAFSK